MRKLMSFLVAAFSVLAASAQTSIQVQAPNLVGVNEQFNVTFVIDGEHSQDNFQWDPGSDFQLVWGPQRGFSSSTKYVNGKREHSAQTTFTYILLPKNTGRFHLAAAEATVKGEKIYSGRPTVEVVADGEAARKQGGGQPAQGGRQGGSAQTGNVSADDLFLRMTLSKKDVMVGEPVTVTLKLYQRGIRLGGV